MNDYEEITGEIESNLCEALFSNRHDTIKLVEWDDGGKHFALDFSYQHIGGLEGWYQDTYEGTLYINNKAFYFSFVDVFCDEGKLEFERDPGADLQPGEWGYHETKYDKLNKAIDKALSSPETWLKSEFICIEPKDTLNTEHNKGVTQMATTTEMKVATVYLLDEDEALKGTDLNLVGKFKDVVIPAGQDTQMTLLKLAMTGKMQKMLDQHNEKRALVVNNKTLERTGNKVFLQPVAIEDLKVSFSY